MLAILTVAALGAGMAGFAFADEPETDPPAVSDDTTTTTTSSTTPTTETTDPPVDVAAATTLDVGDPEFGALDVGALATPNSITVSPVVGAQDLAGTFTIRLQGCTVVIGICVYSDVASADVASGSSHTFTGLTATANCGFFSCPRRYQVLADYESGYQFVSVTGCGGTAVSAGLLTAGGRNFGSWVNNQELACTFNYSEYKVSVTKSVTDAPGSWSFPLRLFSLGVYDQTLDATDAAPTVTFRQVPTSLLGYALTESTPEGWRLTDVSCSGGDTLPWFELIPLRQTGVSFGGLFGSPNRSCTFTNSNNRVSVTKFVDPKQYEGSFDIVLEECEFNVLGLCLGNWDEVATQSVAVGSPTTFSSLDGTYFDRYYRVSEVVPDGWTSEIECEGGRQHSVDDGYAYFLFPLDLNAAAAVSCDVVNTAQPSSLTIAKSTDPSGGGPFDFVLGGENIDPFHEFSLSDTESESFDLELGDYTLTETGAPADEDWVFADLTCAVDPDSPNTAPVTPVAAGEGAWTIPLGAGQDVTCTADNREASIALDITASPTSGVVGDTITFTYDVTNTGKVPLTNVTVVSDLFGPITLGTTDLGPGDSTSGTFDHTAVAGDVPQITDTATATGDIDTGAIVLPDVDTQALDPVSVTATSEVTVGIAQVGGETVTRDGGASTSGQLPFTGNDSTGLLAGGFIALLTGLALGALAWRSRRGALEG